MQNLATAMRTVFPTLESGALVPQLKLKDCPNWDSMTAVNLVMEIESLCGAKMESYEPKDDSTLADVAAAIAERGGRP
jgi:acyl carrier protein